MLMLEGLDPEDVGELDADDDPDEAEVLMLIDVDPEDVSDSEDVGTLDVDDPEEVESEAELI